MTSDFGIYLVISKLHSWSSNGVCLNITSNNYFKAGLEIDDFSKERKRSYAWMTARDEDDNDLPTPPDISSEHVLMIRKGVKQSK